MKSLKKDTSNNTKPPQLLNLAGLIKSLLSVLALFGATATVDALDVNKGEHIVLLGNTLAERMQHHGWLEPTPNSPCLKRNWSFAITVSPATRWTNVHAIADS